jgi:hypothetical protein
MPDDIRTDIADILRSKEVVLDGTYHLNTESAWLLADEIIKVLSLRREWGALDENQDGPLGEDYDDVAGYSGTIHTRYITTWRRSENPAIPAESDNKENE